MKVESNYNLLHHNTFRISATCDRYIEVDTVEELKAVAPSLEDGQNLLIIGAGSNLLLTDDFHGTVVRAAIKGISVSVTGNNVLLKCGAGETWDNVVSFCVDNGWHGIENLSHIPGNVGATAVQNIGAYGVEVCSFITHIDAIEIATGRQLTFSNSECQYGYRQSNFKHKWHNKYIITHVTYRLSKAYMPQLDYGNIRQQLEKQGIDMPTPRQLRDVIIDIRRTKLPDPEVEGNAGSFFMNPVVSQKEYQRLKESYPLMPAFQVDSGHIKIPAGWLIDQCGWKGRTLGRVGVHPKQALVLINKGNATGLEVLNLCRAIQKDVKETFGIDLKPEVNII